MRPAPRSWSARARADADDLLKPDVTLYGDLLSESSSVAPARWVCSHADLLDERLGGRFHRRPRGWWVRVDGPWRGAVSFPHRADARARRFSVRQQAVRDHAAVGDGSVDAR